MPDGFTIDLDEADKAAAYPGGDKEIDDASLSLENTFTWMLDDELPASGYPKEHINGIRRDREIFLSLDPQKLHDEYGRIYEASLKVGDNYEAVSALRESIRHLNAWTGKAADAFKNQIDKMEIFCDEQQTRILHTQGRRSRGPQCQGEATEGRHQA
jgi:hypothetical protein